MQTFPDYIIKVGASLIDIYQVRGRREPPIFHHLDTEPGFDSTTSAERMSQITFQCMDWHAPSQYFGSCLALRYIAPFSSCSVGVDKAYRLRRQFRILHRQFQ